MFNITFFGTRLPMLTKQLCLFEGMRPLASFLAYLSFYCSIHKQRKRAAQESSLFWIENEKILIDVVELCYFKC